VSPLILNDLAPEQLGRALTERFGASPTEVPKLFSAIHGPRGALALGAEIGAIASTRSVRRTVLDAIEGGAEVRRLKSLGFVTSERDGFRRYLFETWDQQRVEAVRIPLPCDVYGTVPPQRLVTRPHYVVCVSSQVGCALGCAFCATGKLGFRRNLTTWEIIEQVRLVRADAADPPDPRGKRPIRGVVFMGMGEPFLNYDRVMAAAQIFSAPACYAISADRITISTAGVVPGIRRFTAEARPYRLAVSLTAATSEKRRQVMPIEATWPLDELMAAVREYQSVRGGRAMLAWVAIDGFNTGASDAAELAALTKGLPIRLDLIEVADPDGDFRPPSEHGLSEFRSKLAILGQPVVRRYSGGRDIRAGCGMLAASPLDSPLSSRDQGDPQLPGSAASL
jgi:23S rRNA (adenine2503-C2)-methyltransferase